MNPTKPCRGHAAESERAEGIEAAVRELRLFIMGESLQTRKEASKHLETLVAECDRLSSMLDHQRDEATETERMLRSELETERIRLAACGVVALSNTPESAAKARDMLPEYRSASCDDVARMVDEQMHLRASLTNSQNRLFDVLVGDDGQAWKEAERYLERERPDLYGALNQRVQRGAALDVERLSNVIRSADGANNLGAGALAEKIVEAVGTPAEDTKLLEWMQFHGARVAWVNDDEFCYVTWSDRDDTYRTALFSDWREAIRAAMRGDARPAVDRLAPATPAEIFDAAQRLIARAQHAGVVLTIETVSIPPWAMGRYAMRAAIRPARHATEQKA